MECDEVCGKKRWRRSKGDTWWWNEEMKGQLQERKMHTWQCVRILLRRIRVGIKA